MHRLISARTTVSSQRFLSKRHFRLPPEFKPLRLLQHTVCRPTIKSHGKVRWHGGGPGNDAPTVNITFVNPDDSRTTIACRVGETLLQMAHRTGLEMEGACEGVCACSTCHVILEQDLYDELLDDMEDGCLSEDEEDMMDMAFGLTQTSRLGCQIVVTENMEDTIITMPKATRNFYVDGHKPIPH